MEVGEGLRITGVCVEIEFYFIYCEADLIDLIHQLAAIYPAGVLYGVVLHIHLRSPPFPRNGLSSSANMVPLSSALQGS